MPRNAGLKVSLYQERMYGKKYRRWRYTEACWSQNNPRPPPPPPPPSTRVPLYIATTMHFTMQRIYTVAKNHRSLFVFIHLPLLHSRFSLFHVSLWRRAYARNVRLYLLSVSAVHQPFYISICIWTLPTQHTTFISLYTSCTLYNLKCTVTLRWCYTWQYDSICVTWQSIYWTTL